MNSQTLGRFLRDFRSRHGPDLSDGALLERYYARREEAAFTLLVHRHGPMVFAVCRRLLQNVHDAEDAFQATFVVLVRNARSIRNKSSLAGWLHGVARRIALRAGAQARTRQRHEGRIRPCTVEQPLTALIEKESRTLLEEAIADLPQKYRDAVILCYLEHKTYEQAAILLGCPKSSLASRLERARQMLHERLTCHGTDLTEGLAGTILTARVVPVEVPARLILEVVRAASAIVGKSANVAAVSAQVAALADSAFASLSISNFKVLIAAGLLLALTASGAIVHLATMSSPEGKGEENVPLAEKKADNSPELTKRTDLQGDPLPLGAMVRLGTERFRGVPQDWSATFDAQKNTYVFGDTKGVVLSEIKTGRVLRRFQGGESWVQRHAAISRDGKLIAGPDGPFDRIIRIWDAATGTELRQIKSKKLCTGLLLFAPDGKQLAAELHDRSTTLYDLETGKIIWERPWFSPRVFSADRKVLIGEEGKIVSTIVFLDAASGREVHRLTGIPWSHSIVLSEDLKLLAIKVAIPRGPWVIQLWEVDKGIKRWEIPGIHSIGEPLAFSPDSKTLAWSHQKKEGIGLLDVASGKELRRVAKGIVQARHLSYLNDNDTLAFCQYWEDSMRIWDIAQDRELHPMDGHRGYVSGAFYLRDGRTLVSAGMDGTIRFWDLAGGKELHRIEAHYGGVWGLAITSDTMTLATASPNDDGIRLWNAMTCAEKGYLAAKDQVDQLVFSPDGKTLVTAKVQDDDEHPEILANTFDLCMLEATSGKELRRWQIHSECCPLAFSQDGAHLAGMNAGAVVVWNALTGHQQQRFPVPESTKLGGVCDLVFSPDGITLVSTRAGGLVKNPQSAIVFWELRSGKERFSVKLAPSFGKSLALSPDGKYLAVGGADRRVHVLDAGTGEDLRQFAGHHGEISTIAFSPDGKSVASGSHDTTLLVWKVDDLTQRARHPALKRTPQELEAFWSDLQNPDATRAHRAILALTASASVVPFLGERVKPVPAADAVQIARLLAELDNKKFSIREHAAAELARLADLAEPALRKALQPAPSPDFERRAEALLQKLEEPVTSPEMLRTLRAIEVLERIGSPEARKLLSRLASGCPESRITQAAAAALRRAKQ